MTLNCIRWLVSSTEESVEYSFHCHYSHVHSDTEWFYLLGSHLLVKYNRFENYVY